MSPIPITLLSGFLGSGKTTLLENILTKDHGLKVAVIINDMSVVNIDAALVLHHKVTNTEEKLIQLQNGCICCTLRGDLLEELVSLAKNGEFQYIVIESTGISEPMQVAETFTTEFTEMLLESGEGKDLDILQNVYDMGGIQNLTSLDTCVTVVDAHSFVENFETTDFLIDRFGDNGQNEAERTITDLLVDQIEFANVIIINKKSTVKKPQLSKIHHIIKSLNPAAKILESDYSNVDVKEIINTKQFDFEKASASAGWLKSIQEMTLRDGFGDKTKSKLTPKPETEEYGITNFVYTSRKPFHPERLYKLIRDKFVIIEHSGIDNEEQQNIEEDQEGEEEEEEEEEDSDLEMEDDSTETETVENKKKSVFGPLLRSKGFFWLASRHIIRGEWSSAGTMLTLNGGVPWFDVSGCDSYPPEVKKLIEKDMKGEFGDRRNEIVFIGLSIDKEKITEALDACLLTDDEYFEFTKAVRGQRNLFFIEKNLQKIYNDGFAEWLTFDDDDIENVNDKIAVEQHKGHSHVKVNN